jgi:hypothetical protein
MSKKTVPAGFKVFAFPVNPHELLVLCQDGRMLNKVHVDSEMEAKEIMQGEAMNLCIIDKLESTNFSTIWVDDPAGDLEVIEACKKMEQGQADELLVGAMDGDQTPATEPVHVETSEQPAPNEQGEISVHTIGTTFQTEIDGYFKNIPGQLLKIDDVCRFFPEREPVDIALWTVVASPVNSGSEEDGDYIIQLKKFEDPDFNVSEIPVQPQFVATGSTKIIEVECPTTKSEDNIKRLVRDLQRIKAEALASAASYREDIKAAEKALFDECNGKSYTSMECKVENDWESGVRRYIRPDTGGVAKEEQIPYEERQLNMNGALDEATPKTEK